MGLHACSWKKFLAILAFLGFSLPATNIPEKQSPIIRPVKNVVLICLDTVRYNSFWFPRTAGFSDALTPWLERSIRFENARSAAPWTVPSVASVMTGLYPQQHRAGQFNSPVADLFTMQPSHLPPDQQTLADVLQRNGRDTNAFVANPWLIATNLNRGFTAMTFLKDRDVLGAGLDWIRNRKTDPKPFFLYLHFLQAHENIYATFDEVSRIVTEMDPELNRKISESALPQMQSQPERFMRYKAYRYAVLQQREWVARILDELKKTGRLKNTVVILFSDHGEDFLEHPDILKNGDAVSGGGHGHSLFGEILRVPLVIWHPFISPQQIDVRVSLVDLAPTILDWLSISRPRFRFAGASLSDVPSLDHRWDLRNRTIFASGIAYGPQAAAVFSKEWKLIIGQDGTSFLFNLAEDPKETRPLNLPRPKQELMYLVNLYSRSGHSKISKSVLAAEALEQIRSNGYLTQAN